MTVVTHQPNYDQSNGWQEILPAPAEAQTLTGSISCDYLVIGGGYSGLAATRRLAELDPEASVVLLDGDRIGNNAAGRCSGFAIDHAHNLRAKSFADARQAAQDAIAMNRAGLDYLNEAVEAHALDCGWVKEGKYHAAATKRGQRMLANFVDSLDAINEDYTKLDGVECAEIFGTDFYVGAVHAPHSYLAQPAALVRGLALSMPDNVTIYENSMVNRVDYGPPHSVHTDRGSVSTPILVLATNGFTEGFGFLQKHLIPLITWGSMTRALTASESEQLGGYPSYGIIAAHPAGTSVRRVTTPDNRLLVRNIFSFSKRSDFVSRKSWAAKTHRRSFDSRWPELRDVPFEFSWGGALSLSRNGEPVFGELRSNVFGTVVHNGVGMARGTISGKLLAELIVGQDSELLRQMQAKGRPSRNLPFQNLGVRLNARTRRLIAGREE